jgi:hypothetical protein
LLNAIILLSKMKKSKRIFSLLSRTLLEKGLMLRLTDLSKLIALHFNTQNIMKLSGKSTKFSSTTTKPKKTRTKTPHYRILLDGSVKFQYLSVSV